MANLYAIVPPQTELASLQIIEHDAIGRERFARNGVMKDVHVVVKNHPFRVKIQLAGSLLPNGSTILPHQIGLEVSLLYDTDSLKEVDYVRVKPLDYRLHVNDDGSTTTVESRIKVLTSQLEDMFFRLCIRGVDAQTGELLPGLDVLTGALKVISKLEQAKLSGKKAPPKPRAKKRPVNEILCDALGRIEKQQLEHQTLLAQLLQARNGGDGSSVVSLSAPPVVGSQVSKQLTLVSGRTEEERPPFEEAFSTLVEAYKLVSEDERPSKIRKVIHNTSARDLEKVSELMDLFLAHGLQKDVGGKASDSVAPASSSSNYSGGSAQLADHGPCSDQCEHRKELEKMYQIYNDFFFNGLMPPNGTCGPDITMNASTPLAPSLHGLPEPVSPNLNSNNNPYAFNPIRSPMHATPNGVISPTHAPTDFPALFPGTPTQTPTVAGITF
eukprot:TRINITY_DN6055_c0_g1_i1.p1 TRINITY_DN6055_c0_g1~~TRINITY_DN6055_c0_g1_i1.p1  ORF type:complete len:441 (+),score=109.02 TRINITY_DN6055_c0_g1_i1:195-1517(+)